MAFQVKIIRSFFLFFGNEWGGLAEACALCDIKSKSAMSTTRVVDRVAIAQHFIPALFRDIVPVPFRERELFDLLKNNSCRIFTLTRQLNNEEPLT
jgi:hypothetical protein